MNKKVLIISGSPRLHGNSDILCDEFKRGALEAGNEVEKIRLSDKKINCCFGFSGLFLCHERTNENIYRSHDY